MLVDHPGVLEPNLLLMFLNQGCLEFRVTEGVYQIGHFGMSGWPAGVAKDEHGHDEYGPYGVCDNYEQVITRHPEINDPEKRYVLTLTPVVKAEQPSEDGWRWHKWGEYIGTLNPQHEYIRDEDDTIQQVFVYRVYPLA